MQRQELIELIDANREALSPALSSKALKLRRQYYGDSVFVRGLIEFTNYCKNNCYYCGIRAGNSNLSRYRLDKKTILACCAEGARLGMHTFVLQGGEDPYFTDKRVCEIVSAIKTRFPDCAVTLSIGEKPRASYQAYFDAGADRYLLRHETADDAHYARLHPKELSLENRKRCLYDLREIGFQVGAGFMVGTPYQTTETLASDLGFLQELQPQMVGIGPFLPHHDTIFRAEPAGSLQLTLTMLCLTRILLPKTLLPATTALATLDPKGREMGFQVGANVVMPNLSPAAVRGSYALYDHKKASGDEAAEGLAQLRRQIEEAGFRMDMSRGDSVLSLPTINPERRGG